MLELNINAVFTVINLIVLYLLLRHFLIKPITGIMEKRRTLIESQLAHAKDSEASAAELKQQYESKIQSVRDEAAQMLEQAKERARAEYDRIVSDANAQAGRIMENAKNMAGIEEEKAMREAEAKIAALVIAAAAKIIKSESGENNNQALYEKYITEAGGAYDANGN